MRILIIRVTKMQIFISQDNNGNSSVVGNTSNKKVVSSGTGIAAIAATTVSGIASTQAAVVSGSKKGNLNTGQKPKKTRYGILHCYKSLFQN